MQVPSGPGKSLSPPMLQVPGENGPNPFGQFRLGNPAAPPAGPAPVDRQRALAMQQQSQNLAAVMSGGGGSAASTAAFVSHHQPQMVQHLPHTAGAVLQHPSAAAAQLAGAANGATVLAATKQHGWRQLTDGLRELLQQKIGFHTQMQSFAQASADELQKNATTLDKLESMLVQLQNAPPPTVSAPAGAVSQQKVVAATGQVPPFFWQPSHDYENEFAVSGDNLEVVTKVRDFEDRGWVIPVAGSLRMVRGAIYRWSMCISKKCQHRPQMQFGIHGENHEKPWRLVTTSRCSRSRDDDPWQDRPAGDRLIEEGDYIHVVVDLRGFDSEFGTFSYAVNDGPMEMVFEDLPLLTPDGKLVSLMPVVSMGGDQCAVKLSASAFGSASAAGTTTANGGPADSGAVGSAGGAAKGGKSGK